MRLLLAMMKHETNTFSPVPTPLSRFGPSRSDGTGPGPLYGEAAVAAFRGTGSGLGAYLDIAARENAEIVLPIAAGASPSRPVDDAAFEHIADRICGAVAEGRRGGGFDGIMLDLHGAMVTESFEDGEGELLRRIRALDPAIPIAVAYDMHANLYDAMIANATVVAGYRTYPHVDTYDTAKRAGDILVRAIRGEVRPVMAWGNVPMLPHVMRQGSDDHPNRELQARCAAMSSEGALAASLFTGFPHADIANAGLSAVVVTDGDKDLAERLRDELLDRAWVEREAFVYKIEPLAEALARAKAMPAPAPGQGPIVLLDHYDNCASGGTMDTTVVLGEILKAELDNVAAFAIYDPAAVRQAIAAGIGARVTLSVGGKLAMPQVSGDSRPLEITGTVKTIANGRFRNKGPMGRGVTTDMGPSVVIDTGKVEVALISRHVEPSDLNCFFSLGIDPLQKRYVMLKSRVHWRAGLGAMAKAVVDCAGIGVCTSDYSSLTFNNVRRPIYPLDLPNR
ncbi:MAG TPA: M81 family metallopeptidase [Stellaceae bacterium]|nr:M81 family metallopeptidase [Stellaceae bacterium]